MVKICPRCKFANKSLEKECSTCGYVFSEKLLVEPNQFSQHAPIKYRIQIDSEFQRSMELRLQDELPSRRIACPHCQVERIVTGIGQFICHECERKFRYEGPFQITCVSCNTEISLTAAKGKTIAACSYCGQRYNLKNPHSIPLREKSTAEEVCDICLGCTGSGWGEI